MMPASIGQFSKSSEEKNEFAAPEPADQGHDVADVGARGHTNSSIVIDEATNKRLFWRINRRVLPWMIVAYIAQAMDKGVSGSASVMGLIQDTHMKGQDYAFTSTALWIGVIVGEFPSSRVAHRFPTGKVLGTAIIIWGILVLGSQFATSPAPFLVSRGLLGFFEAAVGPSLFAIMVMWYKKEEQPLMTTIWQGSYGVTNILISLLAFGLLHLPPTSSISAWRALYLTVACASFIAGAAVIYFIPDSPAQARWASEEEKTLLIERVRGNDQGIKQPKLKPEQVKEAFKDPFVWLLFLLAVCNTLVVGGINTFSSLLINKAFGFDVKQSTLLNIPSGAMSVFAYLLGGFTATKTKQAYLTMMGLTIPNIIATICLIVITPSDKTKGGLVAVFYFTQFFQAANPLFFSSMAQNVAGQSKKTVAYAVVFIGWAGGNATAAQIFQHKWAPRYIPSLYTHLGLYVVFNALVLTTRQLLIRRNKAKIAVQSMNGEVEVRNTHSHAFDDLTDRQNPDFRYSL